MSVSDQLAERLKGAIVVVRGNQMVPLSLAQEIVLTSMKFETELEEARKRATDQGWDLENYRQIQRDTFVADGQWS